MTLAQTLIEIKAAKPKAVTTAATTTTTAATTTTTAITRPKARGERLVRQKEEDANIAEWDNVQALMDADYKLAARLQAVNTFVDIDTELVKGSETRKEGSSKRAREELESENLKKQKLDENVESEVDDEAEMKKHMEIVPDDEVAINAIPLATNPPIIVNWKIIKEGKM
ncbi:hypothetical protein Tco_0996367 [Tanacetum coccineum]